MLTNLKKSVYAVFGLVAGIILGIVLLLLLRFFPLSVDSPIYKTLGINKPHVIGFLPYWLLQKADKDYTPFLTTLTYFGLSIDTDGHIQKLVSPQEEESGWTTLKISKTLQKKFTSAKQNHEVLSLLVHQSDEASISALLTNPKQSADNLISDLTPIMQKYGFSDINVDIESFQKSDAKKQQAFLVFLTQLKHGISANRLGTLTVDIAPIAFVKHYLISPEKVGQIADYLVVMAYDYHYSGSFVAGPVAPLYGAGTDAEFDVATAINAAKKAVPANKLILGIPLYGYEWASLADIPGSPVIPASGETASSRRITKELTNCISSESPRPMGEGQGEGNCIQTKNMTAEETAIVYLDKNEPYYHQIFVFDNAAMAKRVEYVKNQKLEGVALWALGYEGDSLLKPLQQFKM